MIIIGTQPLVVSVTLHHNQNFLDTTLIPLLLKSPDIDEALRENNCGFLIHISQSEATNRRPA